MLSRVIAAAALAAAMIPGGIALSNYSGPDAKTVVFDAPFTGHGDHSASCQLLDSCASRAVAGEQTGRMVSQSRYSTPLHGLAPSITSGFAGSTATLSFTDSFPEGASADNARWRFTIRYDDVRFEHRNDPLHRVIAFGSVFVEAWDGEHGYGSTIPLRSGEGGVKSFDIKVRGPFSGPVGLAVQLDTNTEVGSGPHLGSASASAHVTLLKIERTW